MPSVDALSSQLMRATNDKVEEEEEEEEEVEEKMRASFPDITIKVSFLVNRKAILGKRAES